MECSNCGNKEAWHIVSTIDSSICNACGLEGAGSSIPDVYLPRVGATFANLCDNMGRPIEIQSKIHKKAVMDALGVSEAGDRVNGAPYGTKTWIEGSREHRKKNFEQARPLIRQAVQRYLERKKH